MLVGFVVSEGVSGSSLADRATDLRRRSLRNVQEASRRMVLVMNPALATPKENRGNDKDVKSWVVGAS